MGASGWTWSRHITGHLQAARRDPEKSTRWPGTGPALNLWWWSSRQTTCSERWYVVQVPSFDRSAQRSRSRKLLKRCLTESGKIIKLCRKFQGIFTRPKKFYPTRSDGQTGFVKTTVQRAVLDGREIVLPILRLSLVVLSGLFKTP